MREETGRPILCFVNIEFSEQFEWDVQTTGSINFYARVDGRRVTNRIFDETLTDSFRSDSSQDACERTFVTNRKAIEDRAKEKIITGDVNESGGADLYPGDFHVGPAGYYSANLVG